MNQELMDMAKAAGIQEGEFERYKGEEGKRKAYMMLPEELEAFAALVAAALAQPAQQEAKSVTYKEVADVMNSLMRGDTTQVQIGLEMGNKKLYTTPPQEQQSCDRRTWGKPWVSLTDEEIQAVAKQARSKDHAVTLTNKLLKEKNNG